MNAPRLPSPLRIHQPSVLVATWLGTGLLPKAPGTWGSLFALPVAWWIMVLFGVEGLIIALGIVVFLGLWTTGFILLEMKDDQKDPSWIVIDEVAGQWIPLLFMPLDIYYYLAAFALFRFFDILKPWPIDVAEKRLPGAFGVIADDLIAGLFSALVMLFFMNL